MAKKKTTDQAKAAAKAAKKVKAAQKVERKETKKVGKSKKDLGDEEDLEAILENMRKEWEAVHTVTEEVVEGPPSRRANATLTACPSGNYLWCIGGEFFSDDGKAYFYNDVYRYTPEKNEWRKFLSQACPGPRSAHAVVATPASGGKLFLFGGEFSSLYQNSFHHYRDFWCFDVVNHSWDRIETKVRPSARSGCRMAIWKHYIFLFGGFYDPGIRTTYLDDLWYFDTQEYHWRQIEFREGERKPSPRSGFSFLPTAEGILLYGGYCKEYSKGKRPVGVMLDDAWLLRITMPETDDSSAARPGRSTKATASKLVTHPFIVKWEKRKKNGYAPGPRVGCTMTGWSTRNIGVLFGGVTDEDTSEETLESVYHNDLFGYQLGGNGRWVSLTLRKPKSKGKTKISARKQMRNVRVPGMLEGEGSDDDNEFDKEGQDGTDDEETRFKAKSGGDTTILNTENVEIDSDDSVFTIPRPRYNAMLAVLRNTLYIYGGIVEIGPKEFTLDDFYALPLEKLDRYICLKPCGVELPKESDVLESSSDDDDDDEDSEDEEENSEDEGDRESLTKETAANRETEGDDDAIRKRKKQHEERRFGVELKKAEEADPESDIHAKAKELLGTDPSAISKRSAEDVLSTPLPGETLAMFYARSREYWASKAHEMSDNRGKMLRRDGFALAQERYVEYKPVLEEVEKILAEAGLDENEIKRSAAAGPKLGQGESRNRR